MSRSMCIRSCGRRRRHPSLLCAQCTSKELARRRELGSEYVRLTTKERLFLGLPTKPPRNRDMK